MDKPPVKPSDSNNHGAPQLWSFCTDDALERLGLPACWHTYPAGVRLFSQGDPARDVYIIGSGIAKLSSVSEDGREVIVGLRGRGHILGVSAALVDTPHRAAATMVSDCRLYRMSAADLRGGSEYGQALSPYLLRLHAYESLEATSEAADSGPRQAQRRLRQFLFQIAQAIKNGGSARSGMLPLPLTQWEIAQLLHVTPQYLSAKLVPVLEKEGLIVRRQKRLLLVVDRITDSR
ncbi:MAG TPA: Crp/Fnr family transcriptional regulator [Blastocatellia bacterium]